MESGESGRPRARLRLALDRSNVFLMWQLLQTFKVALEYVGGSQEDVPLGLAWLKNPLWWGIWWGILILLIVTFCGQSSKFIYIDF